MRTKNARFRFISIIFLAIILTGCQAVVKIGKQTWTSKNLSVTTFRNGTTIPQATTDEEWIKAAEEKKPAWCYYNNDPANDKKYGKLYNWYAVIDTQGLAPKGWHIPNFKEWTALAEYLGGFDSAGGKLKATTSWLAPNTAADNSSKFSGLPGGLRDYDGTFNGLEASCSWWTDSVCDSERAWDMFLLYNGDKIFVSPEAKTLGMSVRCLKN